MATHPYAQLPPARFWKTAVAEVEPEHIRQLWQPKFPVSRTTKILTAGSCFAQHISNALRKQGFSWIDSEPAPADLPPEHHADHGYGVFSFRTGNIYTAALLRQWVFQALGLAPASTEVFEQDGRYYDPFRPAFPPDGYVSREALAEARRVTLQAIRDALQQADVFVFTLGLTEAWKNTNGDVYPMCPGTVRGEFSAERHVFHNFCEQEIERDLNEVFDALRRLNPGIRFLLTVSPVPLTATASAHHVLVANTYSKSVLRSVAGHLAQTREDVDYFPSYELIATPPFRGRFFEKNLRSVTEEGVAFVMKQFLTAIGAMAEAPPAPAPASESAAAPVAARAPGSSSICEDIILETWSKASAAKPGPRPDILLIGDSQMGIMAQALDSLDVSYAGGAIMQASEWHNLDFIDDDTRFFLPTDREARKRWEASCRQCFPRGIPAPRSNLWIITNIGTHSPILISKIGLDAYLRGVYGNVPTQFQLSDVRNYLRSVRAQHARLVQRMVEAGFNVLWVSDPPTQTSLTEVFAAFDDTLSGYFDAAGSTVFNAREWIKGLGGMPPEWRATEIDTVTGRPDEMHGGLEYYRQLALKLFETYPFSRTGSDVESESAAPAGAAATGSICEDIILETWSRGPAAESGGTPPAVVLIGDSQMGMLAQALGSLGVSCAGGAIMHGSQWSNFEWSFDDWRFFLPAERNAKARWIETWEKSFALMARNPALKKDCRVILNVGAHMRELTSVKRCGSFFEQIYGSVPQALGVADVSNYLLHARTHHLSLIQRFVAAGYNVTWVSDPPFQPPLASGLITVLEEMMISRLENIGCSVFSARQWIAGMGGEPPEFRSAEIDPSTGAADWEHGSPAYYLALVREILGADAAAQSGAAAGAQGG